MIHIVIQQKLTQCCKAVILQSKIKNKNPSVVIQLGYLQHECPENTKLRQHSSGEGVDACIYKHICVSMSILSIFFKK